MKRGISSRLEPGRAVWLAVGFGTWIASALGGGLLRAEWPSPVLHHIDPAGGTAGGVTRVVVGGAQLDGLSSLWFSDPRVTARRVGDKQFELTLPADLETGVYDLRVIGKYGISGPRAFLVTTSAAFSESEPNDGLEAPQRLSGEGAVNGRLEKPGDVDCYSFATRAGEQLRLDLWAERVDSPLHGVLEVYDAQGRRVAVSRGEAGVDPRLDFVAGSDDRYVVRVFDQTFAGGGDYVYRLDCSTQPRVDFVLPSVVRAGQPARVTLFGRNLLPREGARSPGATSDEWEQVSWDLPALVARPSRLPRRSDQAPHAAGTAYFPGCDLPLPIGWTDLPVTSDGAGNHHPDSARSLEVPCEVSGQLARGDERDWYQISGRRGEVFWIEALGARLGSPVDLDVVVTDARQRELARFSDHLENAGGRRFPLHHSDPAGRFVVPADGEYRVLVRNLIAGVSVDPRRLYRLSVRREEPDFSLVLVPSRTDEPTGVNVPQGGRAMAEVFVIRRRGMEGPIRVHADALPPGVECPDVWVGPGEERAVVVVTASRTAEPVVGMWQLSGWADIGGQEVQRPVASGTMVRAGHPSGWGRYADGTPLAVTAAAPLQVTAVADTSEVFQDSIVDVAVEVERRAGADGPVRVTAVGLPAGMENAVATIPAGETTGWLSFAIPGDLPPGPFSFAIQADTEVPLPEGDRPAEGGSRRKKGAAAGKVAVTTFSNALTLRTAPGRIRVTIDPSTPRKVARGQIILIRYRAERRHGFIGKVHTELAAPGGVSRVRGRGVTFTGQTETGEIQLIATENALPGELVFLRLEAVGTVEDQPIYRGARFLQLEITE